MEQAKSIVSMMKDRISKAGKGNNNTFYVKKDGKVRVRFLSDMEEAVVVNFHTKWKEWNHPCMNYFNKPCPHCDSDEGTTAEMFCFTVWNYESKRVEIFMYKATKCTPIPALVTMYETYGTICDRDYTIARQGEGTDTVYTVVPLDRKRFKGEEQPFTKKEILKQLLKAYPCNSDEDDEEEEEIREKSKKSNVIATSNNNKNVDDFDDDDSFEDDDEDEEEIDYSEWSNEELKAECKKRGWSTKGMNRKQVIDMLTDNVPF